MDTNVLVDFILRGIRVLRPREVVFDDSTPFICLYSRSDDQFCRQQGCIRGTVAKHSSLLERETAFFLQYSSSSFFYEKGQTKPTQWDLFVCSSFISKLYRSETGRKNAFVWRNTLNNFSVNESRKSSIVTKLSRGGISLRLGI